MATSSANIQNLVINIGEKYNYDASSIFNESEGDSLNYSATLADGSVLPDWLGIDSATGIISGIPDVDATGRFSIEITAYDLSGDSASSIFDLTINSNGWGEYDYLSSNIEIAQAAVVRITKSTAVMISDKYAITAAHSPLDADNEITPNLTVQNIWGEVRNIVDVIYVVEEDFAIVELESPFEHAYSIKIADVKTSSGDDVFIVGNPWTTANVGIGWAVAFGTDSAIELDDKPWYDIFDVDVQGGFSGGGVFNENGELVGIISGAFTSPEDVQTPYFNENLPVQNDYWDIRNGWLNTSIGLDFIKDFLSINNIDNIPNFSTELPENTPDPENKQFIPSKDLSVVEELSKVDRLSSVLLSNTGAEDINDFSQGGSGTVINDSLVLTVLHALDARKEASIGFYDGSIDADAKTFKISKFGDFGLLKTDIDIPELVDEQHISSIDTGVGESAYHIGSPRDFWYSEGGWWVVTARAAENGSYITSTGGGMSGGGIYNLESDIVGVTSVVWGEPSGAATVLTDRQDPHSTSYNPTIFDGEAFAGTSNFFFLKQFVSEYSPNSINSSSIDFFTADSLTIGGNIYETGWMVKESNNSAYVKKYFDDGTIDTSFGNKGLLTIGLDNQNTTGKKLLSDGSSLYLVGNSENSKVQNSYIVKISLDGMLDASYGIDGVSVISSVYDENVASASLHSDDIYLAGTRYTPESNDVFVLKVQKDSGQVDQAFGVDGYWLDTSDNSSDFATDIGISTNGQIFVLSTTDKNKDWDYELFSVTTEGIINQEFGDSGSVFSDYESEHNISNKLLVVDDGVIVTGYSQYSADEDPLLFKYTFNGQLDETFSEDGIYYISLDNGGNNFVVDVVEGSDNKIILLLSGVNVLPASPGWGDAINGNYTSKVLTLDKAGTPLVSESVTFEFNSANYPVSALLNNSGDLQYIVSVPNEYGYETSLMSMDEAYSNANLTTPINFKGMSVVSKNDGVAVDINGSDRADNLSGDEGDDVISGGDGDDFIWGQGGNDLLTGGKGNDKIIGGDGDDLIYAGSGYNLLNGGSGNDVFYASINGDSIVGYDGSDIVYIDYDISDFYIWGSTDQTYFVHKDDSSVMYDILWVESFIFNDVSASNLEILNYRNFDFNGAFEITLHPFRAEFVSTDNEYAPDSFIINAGVTHNIIFLGSGDDVVNGGYGNDSIHGNGGNDVLNGGQGDDKLVGGLGYDVAIYKYLSSDYSIHTRADSDGEYIEVSGPEGIDKLYGIESLQFSDKSIRISQTEISDFIQKDELDLNSIIENDAVFVGIAPADDNGQFFANKDIVIIFSSPIALIDGNILLKKDDDEIVETFKSSDSTVQFIDNRIVIDPTDPLEKITNYTIEFENGILLGSSDVENIKFTTSDITLESNQNLIDFNFDISIPDGEPTPKVTISAKLSAEFVSATVSYNLFDATGYGAELIYDPERQLFTYEETMPAYQASGKYTISNLSITDIYGNTVNIFDSMMRQLGFNPDSVLDNSNADSQKPIVESLLIDVDYDGENPFIIINGQASELGISGLNVEQIEGFLTLPNSTDSYHVNIDMLPDGTFTGKQELSKYAASGDYYLTGISVGDLAGNVGKYTYDDQSIYLNNPNEDIEAPWLDSFTFDAIFDVVTQRPKIVLEGRVYDNLSGIDTSLGVFVRIYGPGDTDYIDVDSPQNSKELTFEFSHEMGLLAEYLPGQYHIEVLSIYDEALNVVYNSATDLDNMGFNSKINVFFSSGEQDIPIVGSNFDDYLFGTDISDDVLNAQAGNDYLYVGAGSDTVDAGSGDDTVELVPDAQWGSGYVAKNVGNNSSVGTNETITLEGLNTFSDVIDGGDDIDTLNLTSGNDAFFIDDVYSDHHSSLILSSTAQGADSTARIANLEAINAGEGNDIVDLTSTNFVLTTGVAINAEAGNDNLWGSNGNDTIDGGTGDDSIFGGTGSDTLTGGTGSDVFQFTATAGSDVITDFDVSGDSIELYYRAEDNHTNANLSLANGVLTWDVDTTNVDVVIDLSATVSSSDLNDLDTLITFVEIV